jgi:hypothetical protein
MRIQNIKIMVIFHHEGKICEIGFVRRVIVIYIYRKFKMKTGVVDEIGLGKFFLLLFGL